MVAVEEVPRAPEHRTTPLPALNFRNAAPHLRRPFAPNAVRWRVIAGQTVVGYVDVRTVIERLNLVVPDLWTTEFEPWGGRVESNLLICHLTVGGLTRSDVGKGSAQETVKGAYSDALKRAAVHFGVGISLYAMSRVWLEAGDGKMRNGKPTLKKKSVKGKDRMELTAEGEDWLRQGYARWLESERGKHFGEPLDHGDEPDAVGDVDLAGEPDAPNDSATAAVLLEATAHYQVLSGEAKKKLPRGRFEAELRAATDLAAAEALRDTVIELEREGEAK